MIERQAIDGRDATVSYLTTLFEPADRDDAGLVKVAFDDGNVIFLTPQPKAKPKRIADATPSRDPTRTADIRRAFERELKDRWQRLDRCLTKAVGFSDALGLSPYGVLALIPAADRTKQFRAWLDELLSHLIVSGGGWMKTYLDEAGRRAASRAAGLDPRKADVAYSLGLPTAPRIAGQDALPRAAGMMFVDPHGNGLFLHRTDGEGWAWPGGGIDGEETAENAAVREAQEEAGGCPIGQRKEAWRSKKRGVDFTTFRQDVQEQFDPSLNKEHDAWMWASLRDPPRPLHPGVAEMLRGHDLIDGHTEDAMLVLATSELQGICDAVAQQATRVAAHAALVRWRPTKAAQAIRQLVATVGLQRSRMMADYLIVKAHAHATLEAFREAGVSHVGTVAEMLPHMHSAGMNDAGPDDEPRNERGEWMASDDPYRPPFPMSKYGDKAIATVQDKVAKGVSPKIVTIEPKDFRALRATQSELKPPEDDEIDRTPLFQAYEDKPVILEGRDGNYHVIDGHNRISAAVRGDRSFSAYVFKEKREDGLWEMFADAARKTQQHQHPRTGKFITKTAATREWGRRASGRFGAAPKVWNRSVKHRKALRAIGAVGEEEANIQTAGDDRVCQACQTVSDNGPYPIDEAMDLIPLHPRCRCTYIPASFDEGGSNLNRLA